MPSLIRPNRAGSTSRPAVASRAIMTTARSVPLLPLRIGPPSLGQHVDLGRLADIQPHPHHPRPRHHVRRGQHQARRDQVPRPARALITRPAVDHELGDPPGLRRHAVTPSQQHQRLSQLVFPVHRAALDQHRCGLPARTRRSLGIDRREHQLDLLDRSPGTPWHPRPPRSPRTGPSPPARPSRPTVTLNDISTGPSSNRSRSPSASASASFSSARNCRTTDASSTPPTPTTPIGSHQHLNARSLPRHRPACCRTRASQHRHRPIDSLVFANKASKRRGNRTDLLLEQMIIKNTINFLLHSRQHAELRKREGKSS